MTERGYRGRPEQDKVAEGFVSAVNGMEWRQVPVGPDAGRWITSTGCKTVLVVVHTVTMAQRLARCCRSSNPTGGCR